MYAFSRAYIAFAAYQSDVRKRVTSRNTLRVPTAQDSTVQWRGVYNLSKVSHGSSLLITHFTVHLQDMYTCIVGSFMGSRIRDSAAAVHEAAATLGFMLKKEQEKVIVAFTQGHDV